MNLENTRVFIKYTFIKRQNRLVLHHESAIFGYKFPAEFPNVRPPRVLISYLDVVVPLAAVARVELVIASNCQVIVANYAATNGWEVTPRTKKKKKKKEKSKIKGGKRAIKCLQSRCCWVIRRVTFN